MRNVRAETVELEPDMQHISLATHTSLRKVWVVVHVALTPQAMLEEHVKLSLNC